MNQLNSLEMDIKMFNPAPTFYSQTQNMYDPYTEKKLKISLIKKRKLKKKQNACL